MASLNRKRPEPELTPGERAQRLLLQHLNDEQKATYLQYGYFDFTGARPGGLGPIRRKYPGRRIRIYTNEAAAISRIASRVVDMTGLLAWGVYIPSVNQNLPEGDELLAFKLAGETDENRLFVGCNSPVLADRLHNYSSS